LTGAEGRDNLRIVATDRSPGWHPPARAVALPKQLVADVCRSTADRIVELVSGKHRRRAPTEAELAQRDTNVAAVRGLLDEVLRLAGDSLSPADLAARIAALPSYPADLLLGRLLDGTAEEQRTAMCRALLELPPGRLALMPATRCLGVLEQTPSAEARAVLIRCVLDRVRPTDAARALMKSLGFPLVGEAARLAAGLSRDWSEPDAARLLGLLGIDRATFECDLRNAEAFHGESFTDLARIALAPEQVVAVDLSGQPTRALPDELRRCSNLKYLRLDEDYFDREAMERLEALLPGVEITWTLGMYIDGKHGR